MDHFVSESLAITLFRTFESLQLYLQNYTVILGLIRIEIFDLSQRFYSVRKPRHLLQG